MSNKILHIIMCTSYDGAAVLPLRIMKETTSFNHKCISIYTGSASDEFLKSGIECTNLLKSKNGGIISILIKYWTFYGFIRKHNYDILHFHEGGIGILVLVVIFRKKAKVIHHIHAGNITGKVNQSSVPIIYKIIYRNLKKSTYQIANCQHVLDYYYKYIGVSRNITLVENFSPFSFEKRKSLNRSVGYIGRISTDKRFNLFLSIIEKKNKLPSNIIFYAKGDIYPEIEAKITDYTNNGTLIYLKPSFNISNFFRDIDIIVFPSSLQESLPLVILEAVSFDTAVIGLKSTANVEILEDYPFLVDELSEDSIIKIINDFYNGNIDRHKLSLTHQQITKRYDRKKIVNKLHNLYNQLI